MPTVFETPNALLDAVGKQLGESEWLEISQDRINLFAEATGDHQWIHVDEERAKSGPFGTTIAHGYLTLALTSLMLPQIVQVHGIAMGVNYGLDRLRFPAPVPAGSRVRASGELVEATPTKDGAIQAKIRVTVQRDGSDRPVCIADTISRYYPS